MQIHIQGSRISSFHTWDLSSFPYTISQISHFLSGHLLATKSVSINGTIHRQREGKRDAQQAAVGNPIDEIGGKKVLER